MRGQRTDLVGKKTTKEEYVARYICKASGHNPDDIEGITNGDIEHTWCKWKTYLSQARAAIKAVDNYTRKR